jgi:hypothetical protein
MPTFFNKFRKIKKNENKNNKVEKKPIEEISIVNSSKNIKVMTVNEHYNYLESLKTQKTEELEKLEKDKQKFIQIFMSKNKKKNLDNKIKILKSNITGINKFILNSITQKEQDNRNIKRIVPIILKKLSPSNFNLVIDYIRELIDPNFEINKKEE